jgi:hypothetical protein
LQSGTAPPVTLLTLFWNWQTIFGAAPGSATISAPAKARIATMTTSQLTVVWPRSPARLARMSCRVGITS